MPALLDMLLAVADQNLPLRVVLLGGDRVTLDLPGKLADRAPDCRFIALGGTTETAIHSTVCEVDTIDPQWTCVPYGSPLDNVVCRVVDLLGRDRPDWVPGELWIGGAGVARGYRGDPERTAENFVEHAGLRWYRTGDRARYRPDGTLEFLGRDDQQVKIRGHRIELGEVESVLSTHPQVAQAIAVVTDQGRLSAAVVLTTESPDSAQLKPVQLMPVQLKPVQLDPVQLKDFLRDRLPSPMVPDTIAVLSLLPLTPNAKIDRALLKRTLADRHVEGDTPFTPPVGEVECLVAAAWADALQVAEIGREHDFFALGGDSLLATKLIGRLRADGLSGVTLSELFTHPVLADFASALHLSGSEKLPAVLVADLASRHEPFAPTPVQRAYWLGRDSGFTLGGIGCYFYREYDVVDLDIARLEAAVNQLVRRHEMLRAVFDDRGDQRILADVPPLQIPVSDSGFDELRATTSHTVFDPGTWPLFTIRAARSGRRTRLAIGMDNLVLDALSILVFYAELAALYDSPSADLPPVGVSFRDYVLGVEPEPSVLAKAKSYWSAQLADLPPGPQLPLAIDPAEVTQPRFTRRATVLNSVRWQAITDRAREHGLTPSAVLLTAFAEVLGRWSARADLTLNVTLFDRKDVHQDIDNVLGDFTSLLLVPYRPVPDATWLAKVRQVQQHLWGALDHRDVSAVWVLRELARISGNPQTTMPVVFTSALGVSADPPAGSTLFADNVWGISQTPQVWLDHQVTEVDGGIALNWDSVDELFLPGILDTMFETYLSLLDWLGATPWPTPVPDLLPERQCEVRIAVNATGGAAPSEPLHREFFRLAAEQPARTAIRWDSDGVMSYGQLAERALQIAAFLHQQEVARNEPVAITVPKGPDQIVAVLGVLAAGCTYVPVGIDQPAARRDRILRLSGSRFVLTPDVLTTACAIEPLDACCPPSDLAYMIFTSGSTGEPKGVEITHRAAMNTIVDVNERFGVGPDDRLLAVSGLDFDLSVYDIFGPLSVGGVVVTIDESSRRDARRWVDLVAEHRITVWNTVPALLDMLLIAAATPLPLRVVLVSGDWVGLDLRGRLAAYAPACRFVALGGATEASIWSNFFEFDQIDPAWRSVPYGTPLRNQRFRVVDGLGRTCPDWVPGELWIGGAGVARGYRGAPDITAASFVLGDDGDRWYRTGDLGRYWPDGTLEFLGRDDQQVKIRGHRIELGEIEAALGSAPNVSHAVAVVTDDRKLVAAVVSLTSDVDTIRAHAATMLPDHMLPDHLVLLPRLPLSTNGKVDRAAVATLAAPVEHRKPIEAPRGECEESVAAIWADLLGLNKVGRDQSFFALGGDSLQATRLLETLRQRFGVTVDLRSLFDAPTVQAVARTLTSQSVDQDLEEGVL